jgi:hypothetical protein
MSERLLPLIRPIFETQTEIADARKAIDGNGDLQARLDRQIRFDDQIVTELQAISLTDEQIEQLENLLVENPAPEADTAQPALEPVTQLALIVPPPPPAEPASHPTPVSLATEPVIPATPAAVAPVTVPETPESSEVPESHEPPPGEPRKEGATEQPTAGGEQAADKEEEKEEEPPRARPLTILAAVSIGIIATLALVAYLVWDQMNNSFRGKDQVTELLDSANTLTGDEFEAVSTNTANLKDWFFLKSDIRWFAVPREFADTQTLGCRVFKFKGADIGEILAKDGNLMFLFHPADLGVKIRRGKWTIVDGETWVGGVTGVEDCCFVMALKGEHKDMVDYLDKRGLSR